MYCRRQQTRGVGAFDHGWSACKAKYVHVYNNAYIFMYVYTHYIRIRIKGTKKLESGHLILAGALATLNMYVYMTIYICIQVYMYKLTNIYICICTKGAKKLEESGHLIMAGALANPVDGAMFLFKGLEDVDIQV